MSVCYLCILRGLYLPFYDFPGIYCRIWDSVPFGGGIITIACISLHYGHGYRLCKSWTVHMHLSPPIYRDSHNNLKLKLKLNLTTNPPIHSQINLLPTRRARPSFHPTPTRPTHRPSQYNSTTTTIFTRTSRIKARLEGEQTTLSTATINTCHPSRICRPHIPSKTRLCRTRTRTRI